MGHDVIGYARAAGVYENRLESVAWSIRYWLEHGYLDTTLAEGVIADIDDALTRGALFVSPEAVRRECSWCGMVRGYGKRPAIHGICRACENKENGRMDRESCAAKMESEEPTTNRRES